VKFALPGQYISVPYNFYTGAAQKWAIARTCIFRNRSGGCHAAACFVKSAT